MKIQPVKLQNSPLYPSMEKFILQPSNLLESVPFSWSRKSLISYMLASFVLAGSVNGCGDKAIPPQTTNVGPDSNNNNGNLPDKPKAGLVAPIFAYGDGAGADGCMVISPPVFISEEEARRIIFEALKSNGLDFDTSGTKNIKFETRAIANYYPDDTLWTEVDIKFDGFSKKYNLAIEYVSIEDHQLFKTDGGGSWSSVTGYETKKAAELIRDALADGKKFNAGVFYDPIIKIDKKKGIETSEQALEISRQLLTNQVNDFIDWMKKEGIIK